MTGPLHNQSPHMIAGVATLYMKFKKIGEKKSRKAQKAEISFFEGVMSYPRISTHIPFKLNATNIIENKKPISTVCNAIMLGILSIPGLVSYILTASIITVKKNPLTVVVQAIL